MKKTKRLLCLLLAGGISLLAACGNNNAIESDNSGASSTPDSVTEGRYVETDITPPVDGAFTSFLKEDGTIICYDSGLKNRYESTDGGGSWNSLLGPGANTDRYQQVNAGTLLADDSLLVYVTDEGLVKIAPDGSETAYPIEAIDHAVANGEFVNISFMKALSGDRLIISYSSGGVAQTVRFNAAEDDSSEQPDSNTEQATTESAVIAGGETPSGEENPAQINGKTVQQNDKGTERSAVFNGDMSAKTVLIDLASGQVIADLLSETAQAATVKGDMVCLLDMNGKLTTYNLIDGTESGDKAINFWNTDSESGRMGFMNFGTSGGNTLSVNSLGEIYTAYERNILRAGSDGSIETVLVNTDYSIGSPSSSINGVYAMNDGSILVNLTNGSQTGRLYKYVWDANAKLDPDKKLTVWSLEDNNLVRAAITELRKKNPDASVSYEIALEGDNAANVSDAIKTLNTRLLNGSGPDIIILDGTPAESYAAKGMLLDLSGLLDTGDIYDKLISSYNTDGKLYYLPTQFLMPALMGSADALDKVTDLDSLVSLITAGKDTPSRDANSGDPFGGIPESERSELYFEDLQELSDVLWLASAPAVISDNKLNSDALRDYLEAVKSISDKYGLMQTESGGGRGGMRIGMAVSGGGGMATTVSGSLIRYTMQQTNYGAFNAGNLQLMQMMMERAGSDVKLFPGLTSGAWEPSTIAAVSADTKSPEFAAQFIQSMLALDVQQINYGTGLPVTKVGMATQIANIDEQMKEADRGGFTIDIDSVIAQLSVPSMKDTVLTDMMRDSVERLCKGELDVEGAVKAIEQNIKNYLAERE